MNATNLSNAQITVLAQTFSEEPLMRAANREAAAKRLAKMLAARIGAAPAAEAMPQILAASDLEQAKAILESVIEDRDDIEEESDELHLAALLTSMEDPAKLAAFLARDPNQDHASAAALGDPDPVASRRTNDVELAKAPKLPRPPKEPKAPATKSVPTQREGSKQAALIAMLRAPGGASMDEIIAATGWQAHTVRGAMAGALKKKLGLEVFSQKIEGRGRVYALPAA